MLILTMRTDKPEAEIGLYQGTDRLAYNTWEAHRALAETIHYKLREMLTAHNHTLQDLEGIVVYEGPGSFTGLRIGISVANALATSLDIPIASGSGTQWLENGCTQIPLVKDQRLVFPEYGAAPHITQQKK